MNSSSPRFISELSRWVIGIIVAVALAAVFIWSFGTRVWIDGNSMTDKLNDGDVVLIDRFIYKFSDVSRFDIVYFNYGEDKASVKRVIGLPGEHICISGGKVYVDDELIDIPDSDSLYNVAGIAENTLALGSDEYFLLGDNGDSSEDSRFAAVGTINRDDIIGKVWLRLSPIGDFGIISSGGEE